jgi:tetratricopeptide (TPR) repeat protein
MRSQEAAQMHYAKGEDALDSGDVETAMEEFSLALKRDPYLDASYFGMGTAYAMLEEFDEAYRYLKQAIELNPGEEAYYHNLGNTCLKLLRISEAYRCYQKYLLLAPNGDQAVEMSNKLRFLEQSIRKDTKECKSELSIEEMLAQETIFQTGFDHLSHGNYDEAIACFEQVLEKEPNHHQSYGNIGVALMSKGEFECAEQILRKALELEPSYQPAQQNLLACEKRINSEIIMEFQTGKYASIEAKSAFPKPPANRLTKDLII